LAKNPFLLPSVNGEKFDVDEQVAAAVVATHTDPWSISSSEGSCFQYAFLLD